MATSDININLRHSIDACNYVLKTIKLGGANWDQYRNEPSYEGCLQRGGSKISCSQLKDEVDVCLYDNLRPATRASAREAKTVLERIKVIAKEVRDRHCGNCGEYSALAFVYLYDKGVRPIDWLSLVGGDHAFVGIGIDLKAEINDPSSWGKTAVICDPWGQGFRNGDKKTGTYPASEFKANMRNLVAFRSVKSMHRQD